jgi:hypothetical protein
VDVTSAFVLVEVDDLDDDYLEAELREQLPPAP